MKGALKKVVLLGAVVIAGILGTSQNASAWDFSGYASPKSSLVNNYSWASWGPNIYAQSDIFYQCTWYAWGRTLDKTGQSLPTQASDGEAVFNGHAKWWYSNAEYLGWKISDEPAANTIAVWPWINDYGHVAYVEEVKANGQVGISDFNYSWSLDYSEAWYDKNTGASSRGNSTFAGFGVAPKYIYLPWVNYGTNTINYGTVTDLGADFYAIISPKTNQNLAVQGSATTQRQVALQNLSDTEYQRWHFVRSGSGSSAYYQISNDANDFRLSSQGGTSNQTQVKVWQNGTGQDTYWYIYKDYNGGYRLVTRPSNGSSKLALDVTNGSILAGTGLEIYEALNSNNNAQTFTIRKVGGNVEWVDMGSSFDARIVLTQKNTLALSGPTSTLSSTKTGDLVTVANKTSGTTSNADKAQIWTFYKNSDGSYFIKNKLNPTKGITVANTGYTNGENVHFWEYGTATSTTGAKNSWFLQKYGNGVRLVPKSAKILQYSIDVKSGLSSAKAGVEAIIYEYAGSGCQMTIEKVSTEVVPTSVKFANSTMTLQGGGTTGASNAVTVLPTNATNKAVAVKSSNESVAKVTLSNGVPYIVGYNAGTATITATTANGKTATTKVTVTAKVPRVSYRTHVQSDGWQNYVYDGVVAGTTGRSLRLEAINIQPDLSYTGISGGITYRTHVQDIGWQDWVSDGAMAGTSGKSLRLEAIQIKLTGELANQYDVYYRVHAQNYGWMAWAKNGASAGTAHYSYRLEGIQIKLVKKGEAAPSNSDARYKVAAFSERANVSYSTHVQSIGWQSYVANGAMAGTSGKSLRMEGIKIRLDGQPYSGSIQYSTYVQDIGWQNNVSNNAMAGTSGKSLRLEAIKISLTGEMAKYYDVYYRVHAENFGWMGWAKNGEAAGTAGYAYRLEAVEIILVGKGLAAPGSTANAFKSR